MRLLGVAAGLLIVLTCGALLALQSDVGRAYLATLASRLLSEALVGEIHVGSVRELSVARIVLGDVEARERSGNLVVRAGRLEVALSLGALLRGEVVLDRVRIDRSWVSLHSHGTQLAIAEIFLPETGGKSQSTAPDASSLVFAIRRATLHDAVVVALPGSVTVSGLDAQGKLSYSDVFRLELSSVQARLIQPNLRGDVALSGSASVDAAGERWSLQAALDTAGGRISLEASRAGAASRARLRSDELALDRVLALGGLAPVAFDLELHAAPRSGAPRASDLALIAHVLRYGQVALPAWGARAVLDADGARLVSLDVPSFREQHGTLALDVRADYAGNVRGSLTAALPRIAPHSRLAGASGVRSEALRASLHGSYTASTGQLRADAALQVSRLHMLGVSIGRLSAQLQASGSLSRPAVAAHAIARGLSFGKLHVARVHAAARGGPEHYQITVGASAGRARAEAEFSLMLGDGEQRLSGSGQIVGWLRQPALLQVQELRVRPDQIALRGVRASAGQSRLAVEGRLGRTVGSDLHVRIEHLSLAVPATAPAQAGTTPRGLFGRANAELHLLGSTARPALRASLRVDELALDDCPLGALALDATIDSQRSKANARLTLTTDAGDGLQLALTSDLAAGRSLRERFERAHYALAAQGRQDLARLAALWRARGVDPSLTGLVELSVALQGSLERPTGELSASGTALALAHMEPIDAQLHAELGDANSRLMLSLKDARGALASLHAELERDPAALWRGLREGPRSVIPGAYRFELRERRLSELPPPLRSDLPALVSMRAELSVREGSTPHAQLSALARFDTSLGAQCPGARPPRLRVEAELQEGRIAARLAGELGDQPVLHADVSGNAPDLAWFAAPALDRDLTLALDAHDIDLAQLPGSCGALAGRLALSLHARGLLGNDPRLSAQLKAADLRAGGAPPLALSIAARADRSGVQLSSVDASQGSRSVLHASGELPWRWDGIGQPEIDAARCNARAQLADLPLAALLTLIPGVAQPAGLLNGSLSMEGCSQSLAARGELTLNQVAFSLKDPALRVDGLWASLRFRPAAVDIESFKLSDQDGVLRGRGSIELARGHPTHAKLALSARSYPLRADASVAATLDGKIDVTAALDQTPRRVRVKLSDLSVRMPARGGHEKQALDPHTDVVYVNAAALAPAESAAPEPARPLELELDADEPFWVRRDDFGLQLQTRLRVLADQTGVRVSGPLRVQRGFINMLGKGFEIDRGQLLFDGGDQIDPTLTIDAVHKLSDGQTVTIRIRDRLSAPVVTFATTVAGVSTDAEVLQLLVRGREASAAQTAQAQVGAALAGMTSGLLGALTRNRLGKYVPILSLEAGASSGTRMRAGVEANALIPPALRDVIEGAYVEGFVGSRNQGGNAQAAGGVLMELYFPHDVVTGGTWELPNNWSIEMTWEP